MNRFSDNFNEIDPITARPFSSGHPDGVWMISFVYGFLLLFSFIAIVTPLLMKLFAEGEFNFASMIGGFIGYILFLPPIILLFRRSEKSLIWGFGILFIAILMLGISYLFNPAFAAIPLAFIFLQAYICFYTWGLKKDDLLIN